MHQKTISATHFGVCAFASAVIDYDYIMSLLPIATQAKAFKQEDPRSSD